MKLVPLPSGKGAALVRSVGSLGAVNANPFGCLGEIPLVLLTMHIGPFLSSSELLSLCMTQPVLWDYGPEIAGWLASLQHGLDRSAVKHIKHLTELEGMPKHCFLDFASPCFLKDHNVRLLHGSLLAYPIYVGSTHHAITTAVNPPAWGDTWAVSVELQKGHYRATLVAWCNPFHGILDLWLDDRLVSGSSGFDCFSPKTAERHTFPALELEVEQTGWHTWRFETSRSHEMSQQYWMCLEELRVDCVNTPAIHERAVAPASVNPYERRRPRRRRLMALGCPRR